MKVTVLAALMVFAAYFLLRYAGVGFLQDKRFFGSAPKENLDAIPDRKERFPGAHAIGWVLATLALLLFLGAAALAVWDGVRRGFSASGRSSDASWASSAPWRSTTSFSSTGCCSATPISSPTSTRS